MQTLFVKLLPEKMDGRKYYYGEFRCPCGEETWSVNGDRIKVNETTPCLCGREYKVIKVESQKSVLFEVTEPLNWGEAL